MILSLDSLPLSVLQLQDPRVSHLYYVVIDSSSPSSTLRLSQVTNVLEILPSVSYSHFRPFSNVHMRINYHGLIYDSFYYNN